MRTLVLFISLSLLGTNVMAFGSVTPTLKFPKDASENQVVTKERTLVGK